MIQVANSCAWPRPYCGQGPCVRALRLGPSNQTAADSPQGKAVKHLAQGIVRPLGIRQDPKQRSRLLQVAVLMQLDSLLYVRINSRRTRNPILCIRPADPVVYDLQAREPAQLQGRT